MKHLSRRDFAVSIIGTAAVGVRVAAASRQASTSRGPLGPEGLAALTLAEASERVRTGAVTPTDLVNACPPLAIEPTKNRHDRDAV